MRLGSPLGAPPFTGAAEHLVDLRLLLGQVAAPRIGDAVDLATLLLLSADIAHVFEHLQRRIDGTRARAVEAAEAVLQGADQLVAVRRLVLEQVEDDVLEIAAVEHLPTESTEIACPHG